MGLQEEQMREANREVARLVDAHRRALLRYALRRLDDQMAAEELVAETFVVAWRHIDSLPPQKEELFWLYSIAGRVLANALRGRQRSLRLINKLTFERGEDQEEAGLSNATAARLNEGLSKLRAKDREMIFLMYWENLSYREIGTVVGCSEKAAGIRISRARQKLRDVLVAEPSITEVSLPNQEIAQ